MKLSQLKELIKNSMLEVTPKSGATTLQEKDKVKLNLGLGAGDKYQYPDPKDYRDIVPSAQMSPEELEHYEKMMGYSERDSDEMTPEEEYEQKRRAELPTPSIVHGGITMREATYANEDIIREADEIVAAWAQKQTIKEEMHGGYLELLEMNPAFDEGVASLLQAWNEWKEGDMTEPYMVEEAKQDVLAYLSSMMS